MKNYLIVMLICVGTMLAANLYAENWVGTGTVNGTGETGEWRAVINSTTDPSIISGRWSSENARGTFNGRVSSDPGWRAAEGDIFDERGNLIGTWRGAFPPAYIDAQARGTWIFFNEQFDGTWEGEQY